MSKQLLLVYLFIITGISIVARIAPHPANFAPIGALALFSGAYFAPQSRWWLSAPLGVMLLSDVFLGFYDWRIMVAVYASFAVYGALGMIAGKHKNPVALFGSSVAGSVVFYLATNAAVWAFSSLYPKTIEGLTLAYVLAIPFFKNTLAGDLFFFALFAGAYEIAMARIHARDPMSAGIAAR